MDSVCPTNIAKGYIVQGLSNSMYLKGCLTSNIYFLLKSINFIGEGLYYEYIETNIICMCSLI